MADYILTADGELYHHGVKGMKWGVRRDARLLANSRRNKRVKGAREAYKSGKISKVARDREIEEARREKKKTLDQIKDSFANAKSDAERERLSKYITDKTLSEVPNATVKRGVATANAMFGLSNAASLGLSTYAIAVANPAFAGVALAAGAVGLAAEAGHRYVIQLGLDKTS